MRFISILMKNLLIFLLFSCFTASAQSNHKALPRPKLVVGLVVDQMRYDFLYRYYDRYCEGGFRRLLAQGNSCENMYINYLPSYTAPGHTCIYTGTVPALHGIASNEWLDLKTGASVYCTEDRSEKAVGGIERAGKMSPRNLLCSTITDELRLATNFNSRTIAVSLKDRASILPGGHTANAAYWMDDTLGVFMTSTYYMNQLPDWVQAFNDAAKAKHYMELNWNTLYPIETYTQSSFDNNPYEGKYLNESKPIFPHATSSMKVIDIKKTPYGNTIVFDFAKEAIDQEKLGQQGATDFLCISCSATDYIGHQFGPNSIEIEDTYLRLDRDLADFLDELDRNIGAGNYTFFLTADHGVAHNPQFMTDNKIPAGFFYGTALRDELNQELGKKYGTNNLIRQVAENYVWLNHKACDSMSLNESEIKASVLNQLKSHDNIQFALDVDHLEQSNIPATLRDMAVNGYNKKRSGDILLLFNPGWYDAFAVTGTTHGNWNPYDTHIPMLWYGWGIQKGKTERQVNMTDITATLASLLHIQTPNACIGKCIEEVLR